MRLLVSGATTVMKDLYRHSLYKNYLGQLVVPLDGNKIIDMPLAADNGAFSEFLPHEYCNMLFRLKGKSPIWVTCPDVVGDYSKTMELFNVWEPIIHMCNFPVALVLQDGLIPHRLPWERFEAVFIGGTTEFKLGPLVRQTVKLAHNHSKLVHMGRVNSQKRIRYALSLGCHSVDGSGFSRFSKTMIPMYLGVVYDHFANLKESKK